MKKPFSDNFILLTVSIYCISLLVIRLISSFFPRARLWGFNHAFYTNNFWVIYPVFILIIIAIYIYWGKIKYNFDKLESAFISGKMLNNISIAGFVIIASVGFYVFSINNYFLGDSAMIAAALAKGLGIKSFEYGELFTHKIFIQLFGTFTEDGARQSYRMLSIISGIVMLSGYIYYGKKLIKSNLEFWFLMLFIYFSSSTILYFGYGENYSIVSAFLNLFLISGTYYLYKHKKSITPIIFYISAIILHKIAIIFMPVAVYYIFASYLKRKSRLLKWCLPHYIAIMIAIIFLAYIYVITIGPLLLKIVFLHPLKWKFTIDNYNLFSLNHILDYFNLLFFLVPVTIFILIFFLIKGKAEFIKETDIYFLVIAGAVSLIFSFIFEPRIGMARDWDLISFILIGSQLAGFYLFINLFRHLNIFKPAVIILILLQLSIFIPWLGLNNSLKASLVYAENIFRLSPHHS